MSQLWSTSGGTTGTGRCWDHAPVWSSPPVVRRQLTGPHRTGIQSSRDTWWGRRTWRGTRDTARALCCQDSVWPPPVCRSPEAGGGECEVEAISELNETWAAGSSEQQQQVFSNIAAFWVELSQEGEGACSLIKVLRQYVKWAFKPKAALRIFESKTFHPSWSLWTNFPISHILCLDTGLAWMDSQYLAMQCRMCRSLLCCQFWDTSRGAPGSFYPYHANLATEDRVQLQCYMPHCHFLIYI